MADAPERKAEPSQTRPSWHWRQMLGLIVMYVAGFALVGAVLGIWMDYRYPSMHSWTLMLLTVGAVAGGLNARQRVLREQRAIQGALERAEQAERERAERELAERQRQGGPNPNRKDPGHKD